MGLIDTIRNAGEISYHDIAARRERSSLNDNHAALSLRTFHNHRNAIGKHSGVEIACQRGRNTYYIANRETIETDTLDRWMLDSFATGNMPAEYRDMADKVLLEDIPGGREIPRSGIISGWGVFRRIIVIFTVRKAMRPT